MEVGFSVIPFIAEVGIIEIFALVSTINLIRVAPNFALISNSYELCGTELVRPNSFLFQIQLGLVIENWEIKANLGSSATDTKVYTPFKIYEICFFFCFFFTDWTF